MCLSRVAIPYCHRISRQAYLLRFLGARVMERLSSRVSGLSRESQARYRTKVIAAGLLVDPYKIDEWTASPDEIPDVKSSDMIIYMISTPSPTTQHI